MDFKVQTGTVETAASDVVAVPVYECDGVNEGLFARLNEATGGVLAGIFGTDEMRGKAGDAAYVHVGSGLKTKRLLLIGVGKAEAFSTGTWIAVTASAGAQPPTR